mgnify:CR=1 FL=1
MRPRKAENRGLPENLYRLSNGYFVYYRPDKRRGEPGATAGLGPDRAEAIRAAKRLTAELAPRLDRVATVLNARPLVRLRDHLDWMLTHWQERRGLTGKVGLAAKTLREYDFVTRRLRSWKGDQELRLISTQDIAEYLEQLPASSANKSRAVMREIWKKAVTRGLVDRSPVDATEIRLVEVTRQRLTMETYRAIYQYATPVLRNAMDLILQTCQRPEDVVTFKFSEIVERNGISTLRVVPKKTAKHGVVIDLELGEPVLQIVRRCRDDVVSDFLVHYPYTTGRARTLAGKPVTVDVLSDYFRRARTAAMEEGLFKGLKPEERPSLYEVKALGAKLAKDINGNAQELMGHLDAKTTRLYTDARHEGGQVIRARAGVVLD